MIIIIIIIIIIIAAAAALFFFFCRIFTKRVRILFSLLTRVVGFALASYRWSGDL